MTADIRDDLFSVCHALAGSGRGTSAGGSVPRQAILAELEGNCKPRQLTGTQGQTLTDDQERHLPGASM